METDPLKRRSMESNIVADGESRLLQTPEHQARLRKLRESVHAKYAGKLSEAGFLRRLILRWQIAVEFRRERRKIEPSPYSLYSTRP